MSERVTGLSAFGDKDWNAFMARYMSWSPVRLTVDTHWGMLNPDLGVLYDWLEGDGMEGAFFVETDHRDIRLTQYEVTIWFENPNTGVAFKLRWK